MIQLTDINGRVHAIHPDAIARLVEPGSSGKWHGINCYVRTFDGDTIEVRENVFEVLGLTNQHRRPSHDPFSRSIWKTCTRRRNQNP